MWADGGAPVRAPGAVAVVAAVTPVSLVGLDMPDQNKNVECVVVTMVAEGVHSEVPLGEGCLGSYAAKYKMKRVSQRLSECRVVDVSPPARSLEGGGPGRSASPDRGSPPRSPVSSHRKELWNPAEGQPGHRPSSPGETSPPSDCLPEVPSLVFIFMYQYIYIYIYVCYILGLMSKTTRDPSLVVAFVCKVGHLSDSDTAQDVRPW